MMKALTLLQYYPHHLLLLLLLLGYVYDKRRVGLTQLGLHSTPTGSASHHHHRQEHLAHSPGKYGELR